MSDSLPIQLPTNAPMREYQNYIHALEEMHGWLDVDLVHNCFLMGEEVGELFKSIRKYKRYFDQNPDSQTELSPEEKSERKKAVAEELVDVMNYVLTISNRLDIDLEQAFRAKNARNQQRTWGKAKPEAS